MVTRTAQFYLFLHYLLLYRVPAKASTISCVRYETTHVFDISTSSARRNATRTCSIPEKVSLLDEDTLVFRGQVDREFLMWLLNVKNIEMCIFVENSDLDEIYIYVQSVTGSCDGPKIRIIGNPKLVFLVSGGFTFAGAAPKDVLRVRGNKILDVDNLDGWRSKGTRLNTSWDLQTFGECALPMPFTSFESMDQNCTRFYGSLVVSQGITEIEYDPLNVRKFEVEGCIQIEKTNLEDVYFLNAFSNFRPIPFCSQFVRNNKNLCYKNLNYLNTIFKTITFANNSDQSCEKCMGGEVSEGYLKESANCTTIYGDLIIADQRGLPCNIGNLHGIDTINGRLIITNNTGLNKFVHLSSLKKVGSRNENVAAIIIKDNADLMLLHFPVLENIKIKKGESRVELVNNPMLSEHVEQTIVEKKKAVEKPSSLRTTDASYIYVVFAGIAVVLISTLMVILGLFLKLKQKRNKILLPGPPYALNMKSQEQLIHFCREIVMRNPIVWCLEDFAVNWKQAHGAAGNDIYALSKPTQFVKSHIIPAARNAGISQRTGVDERLLQNRVQELLGYDWIIMIGTVNDVTKVVPRLPRNVGTLSVYTDGKAKVTYKLLEITQLSSKISCYKYKAEDVNQQKAKEILLILYQWPHERLPMEYSEQLQLITLFKGRKAICTSDRRKEVFSLLYVLYAAVVEAKGVKNLTEVFNLHSRFCNGAPLDRHEVLYVMRFLLDWAKSANCVPAKIEKERGRWCQIYDRMAEFSRRHPNIVNIHPLHLTRLDGFEEARREVESARVQVMSLSERPLREMVDRFRRKTTEEIQKELIYATKSAYGGVQSVSTSADSNIHSTYNSATPSQETDCSMKGAITTGRDNMHFNQ